MMAFTPTPLRRAQEASRVLGLEVFYKLELYNPTGSHKDRESRLILEQCVQQGIKEVGCASTGNFAISLAYFSMICGVKCHVWISNKAYCPEIVGPLQLFSAIIHRSDESLDTIYELSSHQMREHGIYDANPAACLGKIQANQEISREVLKQLAGVDTIVCCVNNGSHLLGVGAPLAGSSVRLVGVYTHSPLASSISGYHGVEGLERITAAVAATGGVLVEAQTAHLRAGLKLLLQDGIWAEVSSASVVGILGDLKLPEQSRVCCVITGSGCKKVTENAQIFLDN